MKKKFIRKILSGVLAFAMFFSLIVGLVPMNAYAANTPSIQGHSIVKGDTTNNKNLC